MSRGHRALALLALAAAGCGHAEGPAPAPSSAQVEARPLDALDALHTFEEARRAGTDFAHLPPSDRIFGPDPVAIRPLHRADLAPSSRTSAHFVGLLRGRDAVVLLDGGLREITRAPAPSSPSGLAIAGDGEIFVSGEQSQVIHRYRIEGDALRPSGDITVEGAIAIRDIAVDGEGADAGPAKVLYAVEEHDGRLLAVNLAPRGQRRELFAGNGAFRVVRAGDRVLVDALLDHTLTAFALDADGLPRAAGAVTIRHDGPIWGFDALVRDGDLLIAAGGVEDHPLDRSGGSFGFIDSFVFLYRIGKAKTAAERLAVINVSSEGVITPKALVLQATKGGIHVTAAGYGGDRLVELDWGADLRAAPSLTTRPVLPGSATMAPLAKDSHALVIANPLLDGWSLVDLSAPALVPAVEIASPPARSVASKIGEALFFTRLMAPWNKTAGPLSRFTCETCHFEGFVDGRTHHTGRGDVRATTKPLLGLFNNRPHFSRALDADLTTVAHNEFRVAGAMSGSDPWFIAPASELPWIGLFGATDEELWPDQLRKALMVFLMELTHRPNPKVLGRAAFSELERRGAEVFRQRCERCHSARLVSDEAGTEVPFAGWEKLVMAREGALVWGRSGYEKTGVVPYVHESGARVPSLRRLYKKRPYFTNGAASDLGAVLDRVRFGAEKGVEAFFHDGAPEGDGLRGLDGADKQALLAFLDLL